MGLLKNIVGAKAVINLGWKTAGGENFVKSETKKKVLKAV